MVGVLCSTHFRAQYVDTVVLKVRPTAFRYVTAVPDEARVRQVGGRGSNLGLLIRVGIMILSSYK